MKCPKCNEEMKWNGNVLTSEPPKYPFVCPKCGHVVWYDTCYWRDDVTLKIKGTDTPSSELTPNDWEKVRIQAAIAAMQGVMNFFGSLDYNKETIAELAVKQADTLVEELKKKGNV